MLRGDLAERPRIGNGSLTDIPAHSWSYVTLGLGMAGNGGANRVGISPDLAM